MSILKQINENAQKYLKEQAVILEKFEYFDQRSSLDEPLTEAATEWLAQLRGILSKGKLDPNKKQNATYILGALLALTDPVNIDALNIKDPGTLLYNLSNKEDPQKSKASAKYLLKIGMNPSIRGSVEKAKTALDNPQETNKLINQIQTKIDQVMRSKLAKEQGGMASPTGNAVSGKNERKP